MLMDIVKKNTGRAEIEQNRLKNVFSHRKMMDDDVMMPQEIKQLSPWSVSLLLLLGAVIALFVYYLLMLPAGIRTANAKNNQVLITYTEKLDAANQKLSNLEEENKKSSRAMMKQRQIWIATRIKMPPLWRSIKAWSTSIMHCPREIF